MAMDGTETDSICHVKASDLYPKRELLCDECELVVPFTPVCGEAVEYLGRDVDVVIALSNYRFYLQLKDTYYNIPLGLIDLLEVKDIFFLHIFCKDARSLRCSFSTNEYCLEWLGRLNKATSPPKNIESLFAFSYYVWSIEDGGEELCSRLGKDNSLSLNEVERLKFDLLGAWRISRANAEYKLCPSYPKQLLVPACITDETLESVARFRSARRIPAVVWRHTGNGAVIARCSQPEVGWLGWRSSEDEDLLKAIADACAFDRGHLQSENGESILDLTNSILAKDDIFVDLDRKKVLIMDARSYTTAVANRARGGGCECPEYYPGCEIQFMNLANIHSIRKSFQAVRQLCSSAADQPNWFSLLEGTRWLQHMAGLLRAALAVVSAVEQEGRPVLVHCSDGWDRTPQIVALAKLLLDPYYRTIEGFRILCENEWLDFGHKFADRCGHMIGCEDPNERCPVFLQWLDCVHQLLLQFPCAFEFSHSYLVKLAQHTYSNLFGTFLCNSMQDRMIWKVYERTFSVWKFLRAPNFRNHLYFSKNRVLWPSCNVRNLVLWCEVYLGSVESTVNSVISSSLTTNETPKVDDVPGVPLSAPSLCKTRSCDNLLAAAEHSSGQQRRSSDPNVTRELKLDALSLTDESIPLNNLEKHHTELTEPVCLKSGVISPEMFETVVGNNELPRERLINNLLNDSDDENEDTTGLRSETTMCSNEVQDNTIISNPLSSEASSSSVDSSTDTLVAGEVNGFGKWVKINDSEVDKKGNTCVFGKSPAFGNGVETLNCSDSNLTSNPSNFSTSDLCRVCANSRRCLADKDGSTSSSTSGKTSRYSTPPLYSQTPSSRYPATPNEERTLAPRLIHVGSRLDDVDGLAPLQNDVQVRVQQIIADHKAKEDALKQELYTTRLALIHQVCHHCSHANADRPDDGESRPESGCSVEQPSGESVRSDVSWEAVEETDASPTLWVPDHAVNRCMGCDIEFSWLGRRKHHCRNCGKIFCADCSDNTVPLPNEQLYDPVRVCANCFSMLHNSSTLLKRHRAIPFSSIEYSGSLNFVNDFTDYGSITMKDDGAATADIALVDNCKPSNTSVSDTEGKPPIPVISAASTFHFKEFP